MAEKTGVSVNGTRGLASVLSGLLIAAVAGGAVSINIFERPDPYKGSQAAVDKAVYLKLIDEQGRRISIIEELLRGADEKLGFISERVARIEARGVMEAPM